MAAAQHTSATDPLTRRVLHVGDAVGQFIEYWGFKSIHGKVWTLLALHSDPLSQTEVADILGCSRSLVSTTISELTGYGLVKPVSDHRNAPYTAHLDVWPTIADVLRSREWMLLEGARQALESAVEEAEDMTAERGHIPYDLDRMRLLLTMTDMAQSLLRMLIAIRRPSTLTRPLEGVGTWVVKAASLVRRMRLPTG
ncbi:MAG: GbsR/MarR family transcriptional regulator [Bradymonadia bacterium]